MENTKKTNEISSKETKRRPIVRRGEARDHVSDLLQGSLHVKRIGALADATAGALHASKLAVAAIGAGLAFSAGLNTKHATKQVDRTLSNREIEVWRLFEKWVPFVVSVRKEILVAMDWTEFDRDGHSTIAIYQIASHGRATPLVWKSHRKADLASGGRTRAEDELLARLEQCLPDDVQVTVLADRGFGDKALFQMLDDWGWRYVIRLKKSVTVTPDGAAPQAAGELLLPSGRAKLYRNVTLTKEDFPLPSFVAVRAKKMKDPWLLASNKEATGATELVKLYGKRFRIEETFRDQKDSRFGFGLADTRVRSPERRDRLLLVFALGYSLVVLLGAAGEACGLDRMLKINTVKTRTMSLFNQGSFWFDALPNMPEERANRLLDAYEKVIHQHETVHHILAVL